MKVFWSFALLTLYLLYTYIYTHTHSICFIYIHTVREWSRSVRSDSLQPRRLQPTSLLCPWDSPSKDTGVGCHFLLQGIFLNQGSNLCLLHCQADSLPLSHLGSPSYPEHSPLKKIKLLGNSTFKFLSWKVSVFLHYLQLWFVHFGPWIGPSKELEKTEGYRTHHVSGAVS